ncbi:MAG: hypothetical protein ACRC5C_03345 [Bacilli bacterium]
MTREDKNNEVIKMSLLAKPLNGPVIISKKKSEDFLKLLSTHKPNLAHKQRCIELANAKRKDK